MSDPLTHVRRKLAIVTKDKDVCKKAKSLDLI